MRLMLRQQKNIITFTLMFLWSCLYVSYANHCRTFVYFICESLL